MKKELDKAIQKEMEAEKAHKRKVAEQKITPELDGCVITEEPDIEMMYDLAELF